MKAIASQPEFAGYEYITGAFPDIGGVISGLMKIKTMCKMVGTWNPQEMV